MTLDFIWASKMIISIQRFAFLYVRYIFFVMNTNPCSWIFSTFSPEFPMVYQSDGEQERLLSLYQELHSCLHHPTRPLRYYYRCRETENLLAQVSLVL